MTKRITKAGLVFLRLKVQDPKAVYAGLLWVAKQKKFKRPEGWVFHKFVAIFSKRPKPLSKIEPIQPSSDLLTWLERERRNYGTRMKRLDAANALEASKHLDRIEAVLSDLESNPLAHNPSYAQKNDLEALAIVEGLVADRVPSHD